MTGPEWAYALRGLNLSWSEVAEELGYASPDVARVAAVRYAKRNGLPSATEAWRRRRAEWLETARSIREAAGNGRWWPALYRARIDLAALRRKRLASVLRDIRKVTGRRPYRDPVGTETWDTWGP